MDKTMIINFDYFKPKGDVLDVTAEKCGIIYSMAKGVQDELCIDYVDEDNKEILQKRRYDACTFFFNINNIWNNRKRESIIKEVANYLKDKGTINIWDVHKERGKIIDTKIKLFMPSKEFKETSIKNLNPLSECNFEQIKKITSKYYIIEEYKVWNEMFYIKGKKKTEVKKGKES